MLRMLDGHGFRSPDAQKPLGKPRSRAATQRLGVVERTASGSTGSGRQCRCHQGVAGQRAEGVASQRAEGFGWGRHESHNALWWRSPAWVPCSLSQVQAEALRPSMAGNASDLLRACTCERRGERRSSRLCLASPASQCPSSCTSSPTKSPTAVSSTCSSPASSRPLLSQDAQLRLVSKENRQRHNRSLSRTGRLLI